MMRHFLILVVLSLLVSSVHAGASDASAVETSLQDWRHPDRNEVIPVKLYLPKSVGPWPIVIVSHGLGGSREGLAYIGKHWASSGYLSVHLQHVGSDQGIFRNVAQNGRAGLLQAASAEQLLRRIQDVKFALDHLEESNADLESPLHNKLDLGRIAIAGHSFGAVTAQVMCGQLVGPQQTSFYDPRVKAGIIFSPSPPKFGDPKRAFSRIGVPMFHWTGTADESHVVGDTNPRDRRVPFDAIDTSDQYLVILSGGDHMVFNGRIQNARQRPNDKAWHDLIERGTTAFLDAHLKGDGEAISFLQEGRFETDASKLGTFEKKLK